MGRVCWCGNTVLHSSCTQGDICSSPRDQWMICGWHYGEIFNLERWIRMGAGRREDGGGGGGGWGGGCGWGGGGGGGEIDWTFVNILTHAI